MALLMTSLAVAGCGGRGPGGPRSDFSLSLSPPSVSSQVGTTTAPVTVRVDALGQLNTAVSVSLLGVPSGVTVTPSSSFSLGPGASQDVTFSIPDSAAVGTTQILVSATSGARSHTAQIALTAQSIVTSYQIGTRFYLQSGTSADTSRVGLETTWGGSVVEVSVNGTEYANRYETGQDVQPAFRTTSDYNWNPTLAGDEYNHGTPVIEQVLNPDSIYIKAQPLQWAPDSYGGGPSQPIAGDMLVEQTLTAVPSAAHTFKLHYKVTHLGNDIHATSGQEFLAVYTNRDYSHFVYYAGLAPWTNGALTVTQFPALGLPNPPVFARERWGALVDAQNKGLAVYAPSSGPVYIGFQAYDPNSPGGGPESNSCNYFAALPNWTLVPGFTQEADVYLIAGDYHDARSIINALHPDESTADTFAPLENLDGPQPGAILTGTAVMSGWAFDDVAVAKVEVLVDGVSDGVAKYGGSRPDVAQEFPNFAPANSGFSYSLDTTKYMNGPHTLNVRTTDSSGNVALTPNDPIVVSN